MSRGGKTVFTWISRGLQHFQDGRYKRKKCPFRAGEEFEKAFGVYCVRFGRVGMEERSKMILMEGLEAELSGSGECFFVSTNPFIST